MRWLFILLPLFLGACKSPPNKKPSSTEQLWQHPQDDHSYANLEQINTKHLHLELEVDFTAQTIYGVARHQM